jgi:hypothetical protein
LGTTHVIALTALAMGSNSRPDVSLGKFVSLRVNFERSWISSIDAEQGWTRTRSLRMNYPLILLNMDISVPSTKEMVACCHRFLVIIEQRRIFPYLVKVDRTILSEVEMGISVTLIATMGLNLNKVGHSSGSNFRSTILGNLATSALFASKLVEKPIQIILVVLLEGFCFTEAPMNDGKSTPLNISQA